MNKKCYIVGAGDNSGTNFSKGKDEYVIAADGGLATLEKLGIQPDFILGDFDSLGYVPDGKNIEVHKVEKDDTDMMLSVERAVESGYNEIEIFGGTGGRIDHTVANFQTMLWASKQNVKIKMTDKNHVYFMITNDTLEIKGKDGNTALQTHCLPPVPTITSLIVYSKPFSFFNLEIGRASCRERV